MMDKTHCEGCRDDFYNHTNMGANMVDGKPQCWSLKEAKLILRKRVHIDQVLPWTQKPEKMPDCYHAPRYVFVSPERTC